MKERVDKVKICEFCGREIHYATIYEDGYDWMGHQRGYAHSYDTGCDCICEQKEFKRMCLNCRFYNEFNECFCEDTIKQYNDSLQEDFFDVKAVTTLKIKTPTKHCNFWKLRDEVANKIFK